MKDYRKKDEAVRMEYFEKYFYWSLKFYDADPSLFLMNYINQRMELNTEQRFWIAWLYGNTYQLPTAWIIANEFPDFENVDLARLKWWNDGNYKRLRYQADQKWQKGHLPEMFSSYRSCIQRKDRTQQQFFKDTCTSDDPKENFETLYTFVIKNFHKFGRYSAWFYIQTLKETCDVDVEAPDLLLTDPNTHTQRDGLCLALGKDHWVGEVLKDKGKTTHLNQGADELLKIMQQKHPDVHSDMFLLETILCAFKKTFRRKKGRYLGYYLDRQAIDIMTVQRDGWAGIDWDLLWQGREETLDHRTIRRPTEMRMQMDMNYFLDTGQIKYYEYLQN